MEIFVEIAADEDGRLVGVVRAADAAEGLAFSGSLELLARLEALTRRSSGGPRGEGGAESLA